MTAEKKPLTQERLKELLHYDPETGVFTWKARPSGQGYRKAPPGLEAGYVCQNGYVGITLLQKKHLAHRLAFLYTTGAWPKAVVDHVDGSRSNNRWVNLRDVSASHNQQNRRAARSDSKTGLAGVLPLASGRFGAHLYVGTFDTPEAAHAAYIAAKKLLHPGFVPAANDELETA